MFTHVGSVLQGLLIPGLLVLPTIPIDCPQDDNVDSGDFCGGIAGIPCAESDEFCKYEPGSCDIADAGGTCVEIPEVCTEIYAPVCGCDGKTYPSECVADAAGAAIDHEGECETP